MNDKSRAVDTGSPGNTIGLGNLWIGLFVAVIEKQTSLNECAVGDHALKVTSVGDPYLGHMHEGEQRMYLESGRMVGM